MVEKFCLLTEGAGCFHKAPSFFDEAINVRVPPAKL
jgi:hypothetical protein